MRTGKAEGWGVFKYYWAEIPVDDDGEYTLDFEQAKEWCETQFEAEGTRWFVKNEKFYFKNEQDMTMFILRWS